MSVDRTEAPADSTDDLASRIEEPQGGTRTSDAPASSPLVSIPKAHVVAGSQRPAGSTLLSASWNGPLPRPGDLQGFKEVDPSFPERIMRMAEREQEARIALLKGEAEREHTLATQHLVLDEKLKTRRVDAEVGFIAAERDYRTRGQRYALAVALSGFATCIVFGLLNMPTAAMVIGGSTLGAITVAFVSSTLRKRDDTEDLELLDENEEEPTPSDR